jgi:hypothetical protein
VSQSIDSRHGDLEPIDGDHTGAAGHAIFDTRGPIVDRDRIVRTFRELVQIDSPP